MSRQTPPIGAILDLAVRWNGSWHSPVGPKPRPLWVLPPGAHDGPEDLFMVKWQERGGGNSHAYLPKADVKKDAAVAAAARAQDVDDDGPQDLDELNSGLRQLGEAAGSKIKVKKERDDHESRGELLDSMVTPLEDQRRQLQKLVTKAKKALVEHGVPTKTMKDTDAPFFYSDASYEDEQEVPWHAAFERPMTLEEGVDWIEEKGKTAAKALQKTIKEQAAALKKQQTALKKQETTIKQRDKTISDLRNRVDELEALERAPAAAPAATPAAKKPARKQVKAATKTRKKRAKAAREPTRSRVDREGRVHIVRMNFAFEDMDCFCNIFSFGDAKSLFRMASVSARMHRLVLGAIQRKITGTLKTLIGGPNTAWLDRLTLEKFEMEHAVVRLKTSRLRRLYYRATRAEAIWSIDCGQGRQAGHQLVVSTSGGIGDLFAHNGTQWQFSGYYDSSGAWDLTSRGMTEDEYYIDKYQKSGADAIERSRSYGWRCSPDNHMSIEIALTVNGRKKKGFRCDASATECIDLHMSTMYNDSCESERERKEVLEAIRTVLGAGALGTENKVEYFAAWACSLACADPLYYTLPRIAGGASGPYRTDFHRAVRQMYFDADGMTRLCVAGDDVYVPFPVFHQESYEPDRFLGDPDDRTKFIDIEDPPEDDEPDVASSDSEESHRPQHRRRRTRH